MIYKTLFILCLLFMAIGSSINYHRINNLEDRIIKLESADNSVCDKAEKTVKVCLSGIGTTIPKGK